MAVRRIHAVALCLAAIAVIGAYVAATHGTTSNKPSSSQAKGALEAAALQRLKVPGGFVRVEHGCTTGRCYVATGSPSQFVSQMPGLLRSAGFEPIGSFRAAEPISLLKQSHWTTGSSDSMVVACRSIAGPQHTHVTECQDAGRVGETLLNVLVGPYHMCETSGCSERLRTGILAWAVAYPTGS